MSKEGDSEVRLRATIDAYRYSAVEYHAFSRGYDAFPGLKALIDEFHEETFPGSVLDLGCGCGRDSLRLAARGRLVVALDLTRELLAASSLQTSARACPIVGDARDLPLKTDSMSGVMAIGSLIHLPYQDLFAALREVRRVIKYQGSFLATVPAEATSGWTIRGVIERPRWMNSLDQASLPSALTQAGFEVTSIRQSGPLWRAIWSRPKS